MSWFKRKPAARPDVAEPDPSMAGQRYDGPVMYDCATNFHYPVIVKDGVEQIDWKHPLSWFDDPDVDEITDDAHYEYAAPDAPTHLHVYHRQHVEVSPT